MQNRTSKKPRPKFFSSIKVNSSLPSDLQSKQKSFKAAGSFRIPKSPNLTTKKTVFKDLRLNSRGSNRSILSTKAANSQSMAGYNQHFTGKLNSKSPTIIKR